MILCRVFLWWLFEFIAFFQCLHFTWSLLAKKNNVCRKLADYETILNNENCYYNPEVGSSITATAQRYGYPIEEHSFTTKDGYILKWFRIPEGVSSTTDRDYDENSISNTANMTKKRQPILLQHGIFTDSLCWLMEGNESLAFFLADNGFDVWLGNLRGTPHSRQHVLDSINASDYWNFGVHEFGVYDMPAGIDMIAEKTGDKGNLIYVGHSMGTTVSYIYSSVYPQHAKDNLKMIISLAPVAYMKNTVGLFKDLSGNAEAMIKLLQSLQLYAIAEDNTLIKVLIESNCCRYPSIIPCTVVIALATGLNLKHFRADIVPVYITALSPISVKVLTHFSQIINSNGRFQMFDYGLTKNMEIYNNEIPPEYKVEQIPVPVYLYAGFRDFIAPVSDAEILKSKLDRRNSSSPTKIFPLQLSHNDFYFGKHIRPFFNSLLRTARELN